ncbi:glycoside hydrolase family 3 protein [Spirillospora sp. NPDC048911]|uniref:glycoside hydrolase family 3 protein n=1 Tax=Spirillospora sp. NPDC048911 TaxID=3364527 RepID=UPI003718ED54
MRAPRSSAFAMAAAAIAVPLAAGCGGDPAKPGSPDGGRRTGGTSGAPAPASPKASWIPAFVAGMSPAEKVGQLFVPTFAGQGAAQSMIKRYKVGGLIYFPGNMRTPAQTAAQSNALQRSSKVPLLLGVDEEQGIVSRTPFITSFPGNMALGATRRPEDARAAARVTGTELRAVGINQNYAPVADVNVNPANPVIGVRSFGSDPALVSRMLQAAIEGYQAAGVAATAKHFPGHGDTDTDSHTGLPVINHSRAEWERLDAPPFKAAIASDVDAIMSAHIVVPKLDGSGDPSTLSRKVLTGLLRDTLGFKGVIVTDSLQMEGARKKYGDSATPVRAINAGADQLLMPPSLPRAYDAVLKAVQSGKISKQRLDDAVSRILRLKEQRGLFRGTRVDPARASRIIGSKDNRATVRQVAEHAVTLVRNEGVLPLKQGRVYVSGPRSDVLAAALRREGVRTVGSAGAADATVLTTLNAGASTTATRVRTLTSQPVIVAALGRPYDLDKAGGAKAALATYSSGTPALTALAKALAGKIKPTGKLPVPAAGKPPGTGLTY